MPQTIQIDLQVDPTSVQQAITRVHQGVSTGAQIGSMHASGAASGIRNLVGAVGGGGGGGGASIIPTQIPSMNAVNVKQNNAMLPFTQASQQMDVVMARATAMSNQVAQQAIMRHSDQMMPRSGNYRTVEAVRSIAGVGEQMGAFSVGGMIGTAVGGPIGGIVGGLAASMAVPFVKKVTGWGASRNEMIDNMFNNGQRTYTPGTPEYAQQLQTRRNAGELASTFMAYSGTMPGASGYANKFMQNTNRMASLMDKKTGALAGMYPSEVKGYMTMLSSIGDTKFQSIMDDSRKKGMTPAISRRLGSLITLNEKKLQRMGGIDPAVHAQEMHSAKYDALVGTGRKGESIWSRMGKGFGRQMGLGTKWGKSAINAMKGRARTDLGMSSEDKKMIGGSSGAAGIMASSMGQAYSEGGLGYTYLAAWKGGAKADIGILDVGGAAAGATQTAGDMVSFLSGRREQMKGIGGEAMYAQHRSNYMQRIQFMRDNHPSMDKNTNQEILTAYLIRGEGMSDVKAQTKSAMILGIGEKYAGGGTGLYNMRSVNRDKGSFTIAKRALEKVTGRSLKDSEVRELTSQNIYGSNVSKTMRSWAGGGWKTSNVKALDLATTASKVAGGMKQLIGLSGNEAWVQDVFASKFAGSSKGLVAGASYAARRAMGKQIYQREMQAGGGGFAEAGMQKRMMSDASYTGIKKAIFSGNVLGPQVAARIKTSGKLLKGQGASYETGKIAMRRIMKYAKKHGMMGAGLDTISAAARQSGATKTAAAAAMFVGSGYDKLSDSGLSQIKKDSKSVNLKKIQIAQNDADGDLNDTQQLVQHVKGMLTIVSKKLSKQQALNGRSKR